MIISKKELFEAKSPLTISAKASDLAFHEMDLTSDEVSVILNISKSISTANIIGKVLAEVNEQCDRCLKNFKKGIHGTFELILADERSRESKSDDPTIIIFNPGKDSIDISSIILESIILEKSMKEVCIENCKGLCSWCGADLNLSDCKCENEEFDKRWEPLKNLNLPELENNYGTSKKKTI